MSTAAARQRQALALVREQIQASIRARKCHACGCLHDTLAALAVADLGRTELAPLLADASGVLEPKQYDCLGCVVATQPLPPMRWPRRIRTRPETERRQH